MVYKVARHKKEHVHSVAKKYGLSAVVVDAIITAYIEDLCDTLKSGTNINIPHLISISVKKTPDGYKTYGAVSKVLRNELRHISEGFSDTEEDKVVQDIETTEVVEAPQNNQGISEIDLSESVSESKPKTSEVAKAPVSTRPKLTAKALIPTAGDGS